MKDIDKLKALLTEFGVGWTGGEPDADHETAIVCKEMGRKIGGYPGFYTTFRFDANGKFYDMGAYE